VAIQEWASEWVIKIEYIQLGDPQPKVYIEGFNITVPYVCLSQQHRSDIAEMQDFINN